MDYIQLKSVIESGNLTLVRDMLTYELNQLGFESFTETDNGLIGYIRKDAFDDQAISQITFHHELHLGNISFSWVEIKEQNWNLEWEKNFSPVTISDRCHIRAPFHEPRQDAEFEIVIEPKMSFGTGHHETTSLMVEQMLGLDFKGKKVLDMGCGTGILAILASKLNAKTILAIDIEEWAYHNALENCAINNATPVSVRLGDVQLIKGQEFDLILANINRNILLADIPSYSACLKTGGLLLVSGIYTFDLELITRCAGENRLSVEKNNERNEWISVLFKKI